jgi:hypothetical protein
VDGTNNYGTKSQGRTMAVRMFMSFIPVSAETAKVKQTQEDQHQCHAKLQAHAKPLGNHHAEENDGSPNN